MTEMIALYTALRPHFTWNVARIKCLSQMVLAILKARTINLSELADVFQGNQTKNANYKRMQRFLSKFEFCFDQIARIIVGLFQLDDTWNLSMDRTNWKFGKNDINVLMLSICYRGVAIPLFWRLLGKAGNSNTDERINLLDRFIRVFSANKIKCLLGDREFIGKKWFAYLQKQEIPFVFRVKSGFNVLTAKGKKVKAKKLFNQLARQEYYTIPQKVMMHGTSIYLVGERLINGEIKILATNQCSGDALKLYDLRDEIEYLFGCLKTRGFRFEDTHLTHSNRIEKLIAVMAIAFCWSHRCGDLLDEKKPIKRKNHGRREKSIFKYGYEYLRKLISNVNLRFDEFTLAVGLIYDGNKPHDRLKLVMGG